MGFIIVLQYLTAWANPKWPNFRKFSEPNPVKHMEPYFILIFMAIVTIQL